MSGIKITTLNSKILILNSDKLSSMEWYEDSGHILFRTTGLTYIICRVHEGSIYDRNEYPVDENLYNELVYKLFDVKL